MAERQIPGEVADALANYVYVLRDPRDGSVFNVGKGTGQRVFSHVQRTRVGLPDPDLDPPKVARIRAILDADLEVEHLFVRSGITDESTAYIVEQAVIDAFRASGNDLTNRHAGHHSSSNGLATVADAIAAHEAAPAPPLPPGSVVFLINRAWKPGDSAAAAFEATHGHWKIGQRSRARARHAFGVARGIIRGAYDIHDWYPDPRGNSRWGFNGTASPDLAHFVGTHVRDLLRDSGPGSQNPVRLFL